MITGKEKVQEHELVLNKIICGIELKKPVDLKIELTEKEKEKEEAQLLLKSVIGHREILGSISIHGFRDAFMWQDAVLTFKNNTYNIKSRTKSHRCFAK